MSYPLFAVPTPNNQDLTLWVVGGIGLVIGLVFLFIFFSFVQLWIQCLLTGAKIGLLDMIRMKLCKVDYVMIVRQKIALVQAGVKVSTQEMEAHYLSKGNVQRVANAVIAAHKAAMDLPWRVAAAIDLAGRDVYEAVKRSVDPKVIDCPDPSKGRGTLDGVCRNGIQLRARRGSPCGPSWTASSAAPPRRRSSPVSARASSRRSVVPIIIPTCWPTRT